jgi:FAD/FMN-containing dehydrogenase
VQSNFGIVTKMGVWAFPEPERFVSCRVALPREDDLAPLIETLGPLVLDRTIPNVPLVGNVLDAGMWGKTRRDWFAGDGPLPAEVLERIGRERGVGHWNVRFALYGREALVRLLRPLVEAAGLDYGPAFIVTPRSLVHIRPVIYDTTNEAQVRAAYDLYPRLVRAAADAGYGLYRAHIAFMDAVAETYGWGGGALRRVNDRLKDALGPNGILSPGKQGIWGSAARP